MDDTYLKSLERTLCARLAELESKNCVLEQTVTKLSIQLAHCKESLAACYKHLTEEELQSVHPRFFKNFDKSQSMDMEVLKRSITSNLQ